MATSIIVVTLSYGALESDQALFVFCVYAIQEQHMEMDSKFDLPDSSNSKGPVKGTYLSFVVVVRLSASCDDSGKPAVQNSAIA